MWLHFHLKISIFKDEGLTYPNYHRYSTEMVHTTALRLSRTHEKIKDRPSEPCCNVIPCSWMTEAACDDGINIQSFIIKTNENQEGKTSAECLNDFLKGRNTYIIYTRARGGDCQGDCDNKSKDRIYNSGTCSSYSRTCKAQPKDSARKRHPARQHQAGQATRPRRIASTYKFMRSQVRNQKFISSTSQKKFKKSCKHFVI